MKKENEEMIVAAKWVGFFALTTAAIFIGGAVVARICSWILP